MADAEELALYSEDTPETTESSVPEMYGDGSVPTGVPRNVGSVAVLATLNESIEGTPADENTLRAMVDRMSLEGTSPYREEAARRSQKETLEAIKSAYAQAVVSEPATAQELLRRGIEAHDKATKGQVDSYAFETAVMDLTADFPIEDGRVNLVNASGKELATSNILQQAAADAEVTGKRTFWSDLAGVFARGSFQWVWATTNSLGQSAVEKVTGEQYGFFDKFDSRSWVRDFNNYLQTLPRDVAEDKAREFAQHVATEDNQIIIRGIMDAVLHPYSEDRVGDRQLDTALSTIFPPIGFGTAVTMGRNVAKSASATALTAIAKVAPDKAAQLVAETLKENKNAVLLTGLGKDDAVRLSLSLGKSPSVLSGNLEGLSADIITQIEKETLAFVQNAKSISPTTLTEIQKLEEAQAIVSKYPQIDKSIVSLNVSKITDDGVELEIVRRNQYSNKPFDSEEAAHAYAQEHGLAKGTYEVVPAHVETKVVEPQAGPVLPPSYDVPGKALGLHGNPAKLFSTPTVVSDGKTSVTLSKHLEATENITPQYASGLEAITKRLGMQQRILLAHEDDLDSVAWMGGDWADAVGRIRSNTGWKARGGWHTVLDNDAHTSLVVINRASFGKYAGRLQPAFTLAHEIGHAFVSEYLAQTARSTEKWADLMDEFLAWRFKGTTTAKEYLGEMYPPNKLYKEKKLLAAEDREKLLARELTDEWTTSFHEFFSERFAKHVLGKPEVQSSFFQSLADAFKELYKWAVEFSKTTGLGSGKAVPSIEKFLEEHEKQILQGIIPNYYNKGATTTDDLANLMMMGGPTVGKPRIKSKPAVAEVVKEPPSSGFYIRETGHTEPFLYKNAGVHDEASIKGASWLRWLDPKQKITEYTYEGNLAVMFATSSEKVALQKWFREGTKGLSGKEQRKVWDVLRELDAKSNAGNSLDNLKIDTTYLRSRGLDDRQIKMFSRVRDIRDWTWTRHNETLTKEVKRQGYQRRLIISGDETLGTVDQAIHIYTDTLSIKGLIGRGEVKRIYDAQTKQFVSLDSKNIDDLYSSGRQVVKLQTPVNGVRHLVVGGNHKVMDLHNVLPYRPHEFSRVYSDNYFITQKVKTLVDGVEEVSTQTFRTASSSREATQYVASLSKSLSHVRASLDGSIDKATALRLIDKEMSKFGKSGDDIFNAVDAKELDPSAEISFHFTRDKEDALTALVDEHINNGRLFESERGKKLLSVYGDRENTLSPVDSLGIEMAVVSRQANLSDWRRAVIAKYLNTFVSPHSRTGDDVHDFLQAPIKYGVGTKEFAVATHEQEYVKSAIMGRSQREKETAARARRVLEWIEQREGGVGAIAEKVFNGLQLRQADPLQFLRTINYHLSLGMFNPSQLLVQSLGMMNAAYIHPVHGLKAAYTAIPLRLALMSDNPEVWRKVALIGKAGIDVDDFIKVVRGVKKSGILSTIKNTSLYNNSDGFDNLFKEYGTGAFGKMSTTFFDRGEEFSRLTSWEVARREWMAANKGVDWTTNEALAAITARMDDFTLGMTQANVANYQRGLLSIPTQFLQYNLKLATELGRASLGGSRVFTQKQAAAILLGNLVMWGTAGNGLRGFGDEWFAEESGLDADGKLAITQGALSSLLNFMSSGEAKLAVGSRFGTFNWYRDTIENIVAGDLTIPEFMFGVTRSNLVKGFDVLADLSAIWHGTDNMGEEQVGEGLKVLASLSSGMSNAVKAHVLLNNEGLLYGKRGDLLARVTTKESYAQLFGIQPAEIPDYYRQLDLLREDSTEMRALTSQIKHLQMLQIRAISEGNLDLAESYRNAMTLLISEDPLKQAKIFEMTKRRWKGTTLPEETAEKLKARGLSDVTSTTGNIGE